MQNDILNNYFSDITCEVLHSIDVWTLQELLDTGAEKLMTTRGIGKGRFMQIAEVMVKTVKTGNGIHISERKNRL